MSAVEFKQHGKTALITMNRPEAGNAMNGELRDALIEAWAEVDRNPDIAVAVLTGAGERHFCTGADLKWQAQESKKESAKDEFGKSIQWPDVPQGLWKPVFLAINGVCAGGGLHFLWQTDFAICTENATFLEPHVSVGWVPVREMMGLAARAPFGVAMRMALMGVRERMDAERAYQLGIVTEIVPQDQLVSRALEIAECIGEQAPLAVQAIKTSMHRTFGLEWAHAETLEYANLLRDMVHRGPDVKEGTRAFAEKRKPNWRGTWS